jgi:hypothetical protein
MTFNYRIPFQVGCIDPDMQHAYDDACFTRFSSDVFLPASAKENIIYDLEISIVNVNEDVWVAKMREIFGANRIGTTYNKTEKSHKKSHKKKISGVICGKERKQKRNFSNAIIVGMKKGYDMNPYPQLEEMEMMSSFINISVEQIRNWFKNMRKKYNFSLIEKS